MKTRQEEMKEQVQAFHEENPIVWEWFKKFTFEVIHRGFNNYSVNAIFERIRWEQDITRLPKGYVIPSYKFKLNNNYRAFYSRKFMKSFPKHDGFFRTRKQTSLEKKATNLPELRPSDFDYSFFSDTFVKFHGIKSTKNVINS